MRLIRPCPIPAARRPATACPSLRRQTRHQLAIGLSLSTALLLAGCSAERSEYGAATDNEPAAAAATDAARDAAATPESGPDIGRIAAPGVAFTYRYEYSVPAEAIAGVQQQHAAACERLGTARCRVTGIRYDKVADDEVRAALDFLLAPDLAHRFGSDGLAAVERADGKLANAAINGENAGDAITLSQQDSAVIAAEIARLDQRLKARGLTAAERTELTRRVEELRAEQRGQAAERRTGEARLATTPVSFAYASPGLIMGDSSFLDAAAASWGSLQAALAFALLLAGIALPWLGLIALALFGWRWLRRLTATPVTPET